MIGSIAYLNNQGKWEVQRIYSAKTLNRALHAYTQLGDEQLNYLFEFWARLEEIKKQLSLLDKKITYKQKILTL